MTLEERLEKIYEGHARKPFVAADRDLKTWLLNPKPVPKINMEEVEDGLLAGDIILLWRVGFGTFTTESVFPKYFEYTYGIDAPAHLLSLLEGGYVVKESAMESLDHLSAPVKKGILKLHGATGLSKLKAAQVDDLIRDLLSEADLSQEMDIRGYCLTDKGRAMLENHPEVIARHPQKKF